MLTHSHFCQHCNRSFTCRAASDCVLPGYDISRVHQCGEAERYRLLIRRLLQDLPSCSRGCAHLPCMHDKFPELPRIRHEYENTFHRPIMSQDDQGKWHSASNASDKATCTDGKNLLATARQNRAKRFSGDSSALKIWLDTNPAQTSKRALKSTPDTPKTILARRTASETRKAKRFEAAAAEVSRVANLINLAIAKEGRLSK